MEGRRKPADPTEGKGRMEEKAEEASIWLQMELMSERATINDLLERRHGELLMQFDLLLRRPCLTAEEREPISPRSLRSQRSPRVQAEFSVDRVAIHEIPGKSEQASEEPCRPSTPTSKDAYASEGDLASPTGRTGSKKRNWDSEQGMDGAISLQGLKSRGIIPWLQEVVSSSQFETLFGLLIFLNAAVMAIQRQYEGDRLAHYLEYRDAQDADEAWIGAKSVFTGMEWFFGCIFTAEVVVKLVALHKRFFTDTLWNVFDLIIVGIWCVDRAATSALSGMSLDPTFLRIMRVLRLVRLLRVMRWLQIMDPLILMVKAIKASVSVLAWSLILMLLLMSTVAMAVSAFLEGFLRDESILLATRHAVFEEWGSFTRALTTMFEITLANFGPPIRLLMNDVNEWWAFALLSYKVTVGFAVVQVIMSVFIQQTFKVASRDEEVMIKERAAAASAYNKNVGSLFDYLDQSGDGFVTRDEFMAALDNKNVQAWFAALHLELDDAARVFELLDDGSGYISQDQFLNAVGRLKGGARGTDMLTLLKEVKRSLNLTADLVRKVDFVAQTAMATDVLVQKLASTGVDGPCLGALPAAVSAPERPATPASVMDSL